MTSSYALVNGLWSVDVSPSDRALMYGDGVFRTMRFEAGELKDWPLHYQTLVHDSGKLNIDCPSAELLIEDLKALLDYVQQNDVSLAKSCTIKIIVSRGEGARGYAPPAIVTPTRIVIASALPIYAPKIFEQGVALYPCQMRLSHQPILAGIKHLNRLENVLARAECSDPIFFDGLLQDMTGNVIESTCANLFIHKAKRLITPPLDKCGVAGVMRQKLIWLSPSLGYPLEIKPITMQDCLNADDVLLTNSLFGVLQVNRIGRVSINNSHLAQQIRVTLKETTLHEKK